MSAPGGMYFHSSALVKLLQEEAESNAFERFFLDARTQATRMATSKLTKVELHRFAVREGVDATAVDTVLGNLSLISVTDDVIERASSIRPHHVKSLDAIHLATCLCLPEHITRVITFDKNMIDVAEKLGLKAGFELMAAD